MSPSLSAGLLLTIKKSAIFCKDISIITYYFVQAKHGKDIGYLDICN